MCKRKRTELTEADVRSYLDGSLRHCPYCAIFGQAIMDDIDRVFLARSGPGLRHAIAHGTMNDGTPYSADARYACWLMFRLALLPLFGRYEELRATVDQRLRRHGVES